MATYRIKYNNDGYDCEGEYAIDVPANLIREYATVVNAGIGQVLAEASLLLIQAENGELDSKAMMSAGLAMKVETE